MPIPWMDNTKANTLMDTEAPKKKKFDWGGALKTLVNVAGPALVGGFSGQGLVPGALAGYYMDQAQRGNQAAAQNAEGWKQKEFGQKERQIEAEFGLDKEKLGLSREELEESKRHNVAGENKPIALTTAEKEERQMADWTKVNEEKARYDEKMQSDPKANALAKSMIAKGMSPYPPGFQARYEALASKFTKSDNTIFKLPAPELK